MTTNAAPLPRLRRSVERLHRLLRSGSMLALLLAGNSTHASVGLDTIEPAGHAGPIAMFYPSDAPATVVKRGSFVLEAAWKGRPLAGNRRLIVILHGSGGSPWPQSDLARTLVEAGFIVALPEHTGDNGHDMSRVGPDSWTPRPVEVSHAIDAVVDDPRFAALVTPDRVGVYGMSAGGHTALVLAGGRWSPALFVRHCNAHMTEDFPACVGLFTRLKGNWLDLVRVAVARRVLNWRFSDDTWRAHRDPRVKAVVAAVPAAAEFDPSSLGATERAARSDRSAQKCLARAAFPCRGGAQGMRRLRARRRPDRRRPRLDDVADARRLQTSVAPLLTDPNGFDRRSLTDVHRAVATFFTQNLLP